MNIWLNTTVLVACLGLLTASPSSLKVAYGASPNSVFNWDQVPQNQDVPISSAVFDRGGYQLHDNAGETIVVPYKPNSLCALKFARSNTGSMYLVNEGCNPVLYVPAKAGIENANVPNARWYPFRQGYNPTHPVYMAVAPSLQEYDNMGWYPGMYATGGYESDNYGDGPSFGVDVGLVFVIGGHHYNGWQPYNSYYGQHPSHYRMAYYNQPVYGWAVRPIAGRAFVGSRRMWAHRSISGDRQFHAVAVLSVGNMIHNQRMMHNDRMVNDQRMMHNERMVNQRMMHNDRMVNNQRMMHNDRMPQQDKRFRPIAEVQTMRPASHSSRPTAIRTFSQRSSENRAMRNNGRQEEHNSPGQSFRGSSHPSGNGRQSGGGGHQASFNSGRRPSYSGGQQSRGGGHQSGASGRQPSFGGGQQPGGRGHPSGGGGHQASFGGGHPSGGGQQSRGHQPGGGGHQSGGGGKQSGGGGNSGDKRHAQ